MRPWILGDKYLDLVFILTPGVWGFIMASAMFPDSTAFLLFTFLAVGLVDSGHVYTTLWRTYFHGEEVRANRRMFVVPIVWLVLFTLWPLVRLPHLWTFVIYATIFHQMRQYYGVLRWYERLNKGFHRFNSRFLYALIFFPVVLFHLRGATFEGGELMYTQDVMFSFPHAGALEIGLWLYGALLATWLAHELRLFARKENSIPRFLAVACPAWIYALGFLVAREGAQLVFTIVLAHGVPYIAMLVLSLKRTRTGLFQKVAAAAPLVVATAAMLGGFEFYAEQNFVDMSHGFLVSGWPLWKCLIVGVYLTPLFTHFTLDAFIWKRDHREAHLLYG